MGEIKKAANKILTIHTSDDDLLRKFLQGKLERTELSPALDEQLEKMLECEKLIRHHISRTKVCPMMMKLFNISQATAYRIYDKTQRLFGEASIHNQQFHLDIELAAIEEDIRAARVLQDYRSVAALHKLKSELIIKTMGSGDALLYETIQPPQITVGFFPRSYKVQLPKDKELNKLISEKLDKIAEDVEYED